jgi:hypothetical protein
MFRQSGWCIALVGAVWLAGDAGAWSQTPAKRLLDPRTFGFDLPAGELRRPNEARVVTNDAEGNPVVAKVHLFLGKNCIALLPDGELVARKEHEFSLTERPFVPLDDDKLAAKLTAGEFKGFKVRQSKHYIFLYTTSDKFAIGTSKIMESMLPGVQKYVEAQKIATHEPQVPLVVIMFRTEDEFQRYRRMPDGVVAYYHTVSNRVLLFEESKSLQSRPDLAMQQAISTIAHEGTHQILHNIGVQQRLSSWPMWISEGLAEFFAPTSFTKQLTWKGAGQVNDMRMFELEQYLKSKGASEPNGDTIKHTVLAERLRSTGYATAWALTHYLATKKKTEFNRYLNEIAQLGPLEGAIEVQPPGIIPANLSTFEKYFGSDAIDLETKLVAHLKKLPYNDPFANAPHFVAMFSYGEGKKMKREANLYHFPQLAAKWLQEMQQKNEGVPAESTIREFPNRSAAETFARSWLRGGPP